MNYLTIFKTNELVPLLQFQGQIRWAILSSDWNYPNKTAVPLHWHCSCSQTFLVYYLVNNNNFFPITSLSHTHKLYYLHTTHRLLTLQQANCLSWVFSFCEHHWSPEQLCPVPAAHWFGHGHKTPHIYPSPKKEQDFLNRCFPLFHFPKQYSI